MSTLDLADREGEALDITAPDATAAIAARSPLELFWRRLKTDKVALAALVFIVLLILRGDLRAADRQARRRAGRRTSSRPSALDAFGTPDRAEQRAPLRRRPARPRRLQPRALRRARLARGGAHRHRASPSSIGVIMGMIAGFYRGWVDTVLSRLIDVLLAFPILLLGDRPRVRLLARQRLPRRARSSPASRVVIFVIAFVNWTYIARIIRGQVLSLREKEFVEAARSLGRVEPRASSSARSCPTWSRRSSSTAR